MSRSGNMPLEEWVWSRFLSPARSVPVSEAADQLRSAKTVLLVNLDRGFSDLLAQTPILHNLRLYLPRARLLFLGDPRSAPIIRGHPDVDEVFSLSLRDLLAPFHALGLIRRLRDSGVDVCIPLSGDRTTVSFARRFHPKLVVGMGEETAKAAPGFDCVVPPSEDTRVHIVDYNLTLLEKLEVPIRDRRHLLGVDPEAAGKAEERLGAAGLDPQKPILGAHVGGTPDRPQRQWHPTHYAAVLQRAAGELGYQTVILGDGRDRPTVDQVQALGKTPIPEVLDLDMAEYKAVLSRLRFFITHDGEPVQIAAGLRIPSFFVFLSTPAWRWAPYGSHVGVWEEAGRSPGSAEVWNRVQQMLLESEPGESGGATR